MLQLCVRVAYACCVKQALKVVSDQIMINKNIKMRINLLFIDKVIVWTGRVVFVTCLTVFLFIFIHSFLFNSSWILNKLSLESSGNEKLFWHDSWLDQVWIWYVNFYSNSSCSRSRWGHSELYLLDMWESFFWICEYLWN